MLIGADVASRCGGLQLKYSSDGQLCGVVFGAAASDTVAATADRLSPKGQDDDGRSGHPSRRVKVSTTDEGKVMLSIADGVVTWSPAEKQWELTWKWLDGEPPAMPLGPGIGEYSRTNLTPEQERLFVSEVQSWIDNGWLIKHDPKLHGEPACVLPLIGVPQEHKTTPVRPCLDYRHLNKKLHSDPGFDPPVCGDTLRRWRQAGEDYVLLDIRKAYLQIRVSPALYRYQVVLWKGEAHVMTRMGFGLAVAPKFMDAVVKYVTQPYPGVDNYYDDLLVPSALVPKVSGALNEFGLPTKPAEQLAEARVLGLQLTKSSSGDTSWSRKEPAAMTLERPATRRRIFQWCGRLTSHYPVCSWLRPACSFLKRAASADDASWDDPVPPAIQVCCEELEKRLAEVDPAKGTWSISAGDSNTWTVWCDASGLALGAALEVDGKVVEDTTQLRPHQDKRHINIAELEAAILGLNLAAKWNVKRITLKIDSKTVFGWLKQVINDVRRVKTTGLHDLLVQRRLHIVSDMIDTIGAAVDVVWVSSDSNIADALTRVPSVWLTRSVGSIPDVTAGAVCETTVVGPISFDAVAAAQLEDEVVQRVASQVATDRRFAMLVTGAWQVSSSSRMASCSEALSCLLRVKSSFLSSLNPRKSLLLALPTPTPAMPHGRICTRCCVNAATYHAWPRNASNMSAAASVARLRTPQEDKRRQRHDQICPGDRGAVFRSTPWSLGRARAGKSTASWSSLMP